MKIPFSSANALNSLSTGCLAENLPLQFWIAKPDGSLSYVNQRVLTYCNRTFEQMIGWGWKDLIHPDDLSSTLEQWMRSLATGEPYRVRFRLLRASDGAFHEHLVQADAMRDDDGKIIHWVGTNTELRDGSGPAEQYPAPRGANEQVVSQRLAFLAEAGAILSSSLDFETTLKNVAQLTVPSIADWCTIDLLQPDGSIEALVVAHSDPGKIKMAHEYRHKYPIDPSQTSGVPQVIRSGKSELYPEVTLEHLKSVAHDEEHLRMLIELGLKAVMIVPLSAAGKTFGAMTLISAESGRPFTKDDQRLAESLGIRAALSVENARLFREVQRQKDALQRGTAERDLAVVSLQESENRFRELFELAAVGMAQGDPESGTILRVNQRFCELTGYAEEELLGRTFTEITHPEDRAEDYRRFREAVQGNMSSYRSEKRYLRKDGNVFWAIINVRLVRDADGRVTQAFSGVVDITERKKIEEAHERTRTQLEIVLASMSEGVVMFSPGGNVTFMNPAALRMHGFQSLEEIQKHITEYPATFELRDMDDRELPLREWPGPRMLNGEVVHEYECKVIRRDTGHCIIASYSGNLAKEADGTVFAGLLTLRDISDQKLVQQSLHRLSEQRRLALDSAQMGWWHYDLAAGTVYWDERFRAIFGVSDEQLDYDAVIGLIHPDDRERVHEAVSAATRLEDPVPYSIEYRVVHKNGSVHWVLAKGQTYYEGRGHSHRAVSFVGTIVEITEAKEAEKALRESEARFRQLADAMPQIVWQARPDGHVDYYNQRWYEFTGMPVGPTGDQSWEPVLHPDDLPKTHEVWARSLRTGQPYETEYRFKRASDGAYRWHLGRALPVKDADGNVLRWFGTNTDIHDQKQLQKKNEQLLESERSARSEAERASRMKDEFLATLSHELRTPLNAILGWAGMLRDDPSPEDLKDGLEVIERNARAQTRIIEDLLDMSRIISGKVRLDVQRTELASVVEASIDTVRPAAEAKGIRLQAILDPRARPVMGDPSRLQQVFWNLLSNAVKFTPRGGRIQVTLERVNSHLEVSVHDTGEGIQPEFLPYVFDRFRQADASITRKHGGLGLGLAIVKQLVELHGGNIRVKSAGANQGTTFCVILPLAALQPDAEVDGCRQHPEAREPIPADLNPRFQLRGVKVLVVDDEPDARALVARLLESRDADVHCAASAAEAFELIQNEKPDVLVSDIGMPGEDGYSLIRRIRALSPENGGDVPAVALTAYARTEDRMRAVLAGFQMHVAKPAEGAELLTMVATLAGRANT